ncbi:MAG: hypothetical protein F6K17_03115, partial [Okeania sp. SIO3C4]|nr:hypothetical protein [Okeania sp. SIO3C4]
MFSFFPLKGEALDHNLSVTKDSVTVGVNAVLYYRIREPEKALIRVKYYNFATSQAALTTLRNIIGQHKLDELLQERDKINAKICEIVDQITNPWGIEIERIELTSSRRCSHETARDSLASLLETFCFLAPAFPTE